MGIKFLILISSSSYITILSEDNEFLNSFSIKISSSAALSEPCFVNTSATISLPEIHENCEISPSSRLCFKDAIGWRSSFSSTCPELPKLSNNGLLSVNTFTFNSVLSNNEICLAKHKESSTILIINLVSAALGDRQTFLMIPSTLLFCQDPLFLKIDLIPLSLSLTL